MTITLNKRVSLSLSRRAFEPRDGGLFPMGEAGREGAATDFGNVVWVNAHDG